jgi:3-dehydroquinate dehydratase
MDHRFNEVSSKLLVSFACLDPRNSFAKFDIEKIARLIEIYDQDFTDIDRSNIRDQLETFVINMRRVDLFKDCHDFASLATKMVKYERDVTFPLVFRLIKLALFYQ